MKRIALILNSEIGYCRQVMMGVLDYADEHPDWIFHRASPHKDIMGQLQEWDPDGIIAHIYDPEVGKALLDLKVPMINTTNTLPGFDAPLVEADHAAVGAMAAEYFLRRGFRSFGYFGSAWTGFSLDRRKGFVHRLAEDGYPVSTCHAEYLPLIPPRESWTKVTSRICDWLLGLPKPVAIFSSNDYPARDLSDLCREVGLKVPDHVALLGVDNDECECHLANPPLSSIQLPSHIIGREAAGMLNLLLQGKKPPERDVVFAPVRVVTRTSTDIIAIPDQVLSQALSYIRLRYKEPLSVPELAQNVGVSRRVLERKFQQILGRSILSELQSVRLRKARQLLSETDHPMPVVAERSGFSETRRMSIAFRKLENCTPSEFRQRTSRPTS